MAKSKRKPAASVKRQLHPPHAPFSSHTNQGGSLVLGLKSALGTLDGSFPHKATADPLLPPVVNASSGEGTSTARAADGSSKNNTNSPLEGFPVEDCSDGDDIDEEQLDFSCSEEEYERTPPSSPAPVSSELPHSSSPDAPVPPEKPSGVESNPSSIETAGKPHPPSSSNGRWQDLFSSNRNTSICSKLMHFSDYNAIPSCPFLEEDLDHSSDDWKLCVVGYVSGKFPGYRALNSIIENTWKCSASLTLHESGWLIYRFENEEDKLAVLCGGPYLVYGRPLILRQMPEYFDYSCSVMTHVPVWVKFPNFPLKCWTPRCLSKLASVLGQPIQCDKLTSTKERLSYARVLVEVDLLEDLRSSIDVVLPNGNPLCQKVIYETLPKFCKSCKVLGHSTGACSKNQAAPRPVEKKGTEKEVVMSKSSVFSRLSSPVAVPTDPQPHSPADAPTGPQHNPSVDVPTDSQLSENAQEKQQCDQAPAAAVSEGWETVRRKKHGNKQHSPSPKVLPAVNGRSSTQTVSSKGKETAATVDVYANRMQHKVASDMTSRSLVQRNSNKPSGSGGEPPTLPQSC
jgi:hypothetical protein